MEFFKKTVFEFFKKRIEAQYPAPEINSDPYVIMKENQEAFMKNRAKSLLGREDIINQVNFDVNP